MIEIPKLKRDLDPWLNKHGLLRGDFRNFIKDGPHFLSEIKFYDAHYADSVISIDPNYITNQLYKDITASRETSWLGKDPHKHIVTNNMRLLCPYIVNYTFFQMSSNSVRPYHTTDLWFIRNLKVGFRSEKDYAWYILTHGHLLG